MADKRRYPEQICPICELEQPDREPLAYFAGIGVGPVTAEGIESAFHETSRLIAFLSAAAVVGPLAVAQHCRQQDSGEEPDWLENWDFLLRDLGAEAEHRLQRLRKAAELWRSRVKQQEG